MARRFQSTLPVLFRACAVCISLATAFIFASCEGDRKKVHASDFHAGLLKHAKAMDWVLIEEKGGALGASVIVGKAPEPQRSSVTYRLKKADTLRTIVVSAADDEILSVTADDAVVYKGKSITEGELLARCFPR